MIHTAFKGFVGFCDNPAGLHKMRNTFYKCEHKNFDSEMQL